jgi:hypothetical protein
MLNHQILSKNEIPALWIECIIVGLRLVVRSEMSQLEKQMCHCDCRSDNLIDIINTAYRFAFLLCVYAKMLVFVTMLLSSPQMLCL